MRQWPSINRDPHPRRRSGTPTVSSRGWSRHSSPSAGCRRTLPHDRQRMASNPDPHVRGHGRLGRPRSARAGLEPVGEREGRELVGSLANGRSNQLVELARRQRAQMSRRPGCCESARHSAAQDASEEPVGRARVFIGWSSTPQRGSPQCSTSKRASEIVANGAGRNARPETDCRRAYRGRRSSPPARSDFAGMSR